jgi:DNA repair exonuclease SbcCD ATPase subunit
MWRTFRDRAPTRTPEEREALRNQYEQLTQEIETAFERAEVRQGRNARHRAAKNPQRAALDRVKSNLNKARKRLAEITSAVARMETAVAAKSWEGAEAAAYLPDKRGAEASAKATVARWEAELERLMTQPEALTRLEP